MNDFNYIYFAIIFLSLIFSVGVFIHYRIQHIKLLSSLNKMITCAISGNFSEKIFNESMLSSIETKFHQYLTLCNSSSKNISSEKEKIKELISDISHQTKIPIANILLYTQLLEEHPLSVENKQCVAILSKQAEKLSFLISSLIKTSRLETGVFTLNPKISSVNQMLANVLNQMNPKSITKSITIQFENNEEKACFDEKWTSEALTNIIDNAIKYTSENGIIKISVIPYQLFCRIDIKDSGIGINQNEQAKIFVRFYRSSKVKDIDGIGLGLFLARKIISNQGGYIKVNSELGKGSIFSVFLPNKE